MMHGRTKSYTDLKEVPLSDLKEVRSCSLVINFTAIDMFETFFLNVIHICDAYFVLPTINLGQLLSRPPTWCSK